jgi:hypothetical protein
VSLAYVGSEAMEPPTEPIERAAEGEAVAAEDLPHATRKHDVDGDNEAGDDPR